MSHARTQIRDAIVARITGLTTTGASVFKSRVFPIDDSPLPALVVYTNDEENTNASMGYPRLQQRQVEVFVEGYAKSTGQVDDLLDTIAKEVETAISADITLGGKCRDCYITHTALQLQDGDKNVGVVRMTWLAFYRVKEGTVDTIL